jgi:hypothetical protein
MQDWNAGGDARDIHAGRAQLTGKGLEKFARLGSPACVGHQPANDRMGLVFVGQLRHGARLIPDT